MRDKGTIDFAGLSAHLIVAFLELFLTSSACVVNRASELTRDGGWGGDARRVVQEPLSRVLLLGAGLLCAGAPQHKGRGLSQSWR